MGQLNVELIGDAQWRKHKHKRRSKAKVKAPAPAPPLMPCLPYTESPASAVSTNSLSLHIQNIPTIPAFSEIDFFDVKLSDSRLRLCSSDGGNGYARPLSKLDTVMREEAVNGLSYAAFGSRVVCASLSGNVAVWRLILHGASSMLLGLVGAQQFRGVSDRFVDCGAAAMRDIFGDDARDGLGRVMAVRYDAMAGTVTLRNINTESPRRGRERLAMRGVDGSKAFRL